MRCWCEICTCRPALSSEGERHHGPPGVLRRPDHLCHHGVYPGGQPGHSGRRRHGPGRGLYRLRSGRLRRYPAHGPAVQLSLRPGPGHGAERLLRLHRGHQTGLLLADGPGCGLPGGPALHCPLRHFGAGGHLQLHPPASKAGRHLGHRPVHPLHRPSELQADRGRPLHHAVGLPLPGGHRLRGDTFRGPGGGAGLRRNPPHRHPHYPQGEGRPAAGHPGRVGGGHPLSAHRPLCPQRRAGHGQRPARLLRWSGRPQPGSHLYADGLHWAVHPQFSDSGALLPLCRCIRHPGRHYRHGLPGAHAG